jgi:hypothetical protein
MSRARLRRPRPGAPAGKRPRLPVGADGQHPQDERQGDGDLGRGGVLQLELGPCLSRNLEIAGTVDLRESRPRGRRLTSAASGVQKRHHGALRYPGGTTIAGAY